MLPAISLGRFQRQMRCHSFQNPFHDVIVVSRGPRMKGITIKDKKDHFLTFDLRDILNIIGDPALTSTWKLSDVEANGNTAEKLHEINDKGSAISGYDLLSLSIDLTQFIDGNFEAFRNEENSPWLVIRAIDSTEFDVETDDDQILQKVRQSFTNVSDLLESWSN
jgi:hypothetical protein